jgi:CRP-like cAMP-binding protein
MVDYIEIAKCHLFQGVPHEAVGPVQALCSSREYQAGDTIFAEGEQANDVFILGSGKVELSFTLPQHAKVTEVRITEVHPGEVFGWSALGVAQEWTARACAIHDSKVICLPGIELKKLMDADARLGYPVLNYMLHLVATRLRDTRHQLRWLLGAGN